MYILNKLTKKIPQPYRRPLGIVIILILVSGFVRFYAFGDLMHYQLDQSRDYKVISAAIEHGPGELPLQGPKAAGNVYIDSNGDDEADDKTTLRLGPLFYYLMYLSGLIFGNTPVGIAVIIALLGSVSVGVFYLLLREYFSRTLSYGLTLVMALSLYFIVYSRFIWNPTLIPFFTLTTSYCLLRMARFAHTDDARDKQVAGRWLIAAAVSFAFLSNMHFLALIMYGIIGLLFVVWTRSRVSSRYWLIAALCFTALNTPLLINDLKTDGENYKAFIASIAGNSGTQEDLSLRSTVFKNAAQHMEIGWVILTSDQNISVPRVRKDGGVDCGENCRQTGWKSAFISLFFLLTFASWAWLFRKAKKQLASYECQRKYTTILGKGEDFANRAQTFSQQFKGYISESLHQKITGVLHNFATYCKAKSRTDVRHDFSQIHFLKLFLLWSTVPFVIMTPLAFDQAPRFFLLQAPVYIIALGLVTDVALRRCAHKKSRHVKFALVCVFMLLVVSHMLHVRSYFQELEKSSTDSHFQMTGDDLILDEKTRVTLDQMERIVDVIISEHEKSGVPVHLEAQPEYKRAFWERAESRDEYGFDGVGDLRTLYRQGDYYFIIRAQSDFENNFKKFEDLYDVTESQNFGTLTLHTLRIKQDLLDDPQIAEQAVFSTREDPQFSSSAQVRYLWRQVFEGCTYNYDARACQK